MTSRRRLLSMVGAAAGGGAVAGGLASTGVATINLGATGNVPTDNDDVDIVFRGCSEVWIALENELPEGESFTVRIKVRETDADEPRVVKVEVTADDLERIPGQFGDQPVFKWSVEEELGGGKILAVAIEDDDFVENPNRCAQAGDGRKPGDGRGRGPGDGRGRGPDNGRGRGRGS